jgi:hypothetical protein
VIFPPSSDRSHYWPSRVGPATTQFADASAPHRRPVNEFGAALSTVQIAICHGVHAASQPRATLAFGLAQKAGYTVKPTTKSDSRTSVTREQQLAGFIKKFDFENAALIRSVRRVLRKRMASANELVYDNYNFFVIGYRSTERPADCIVSIAACAHGVALSFY